MTRKIKRPARQRWVWLICAIVLALLIVADHNGWLLVKNTDDMSAYHGRSTLVTRVIDGDTIEIDLEDALNNRPTTRIRLWGIDCPETAKPDQAGEPFAVEATGFTRSLVSGSRVTLLLESHRTRGTFGRVLAHVQLPDHSNLNEALLSAGLAAIDERWSHSLLGRYAQLQQAAKRSELGIWASKTNPTSDD
ncbi:MAG: thermonuclease family protein [Planctomycetes bacterium]|nr:thermonuclease family protein [Planctomycetota bacterium]